MRRFFEYLRVTLWRCRVKTCCCLAPLRAGLICIAYLNSIIAVVQIVGTANSAAPFQPMLAHVQGDVLDDDPSPAACVLPPAADLAFNAVLLSALYRRDVVLLRVYGWYGLVSIILSVMVYGLLEAVINALYLFVIIFNGIYQTYILVLVRSLIIEIQLQRASDKNEFIYNKEQGTVIIRDVESPTPAILPALPEPKMTTSITTLATLNEQSPDITLESRNNTLNKSLKTSTLKSCRSTQDAVDVGAQKSATLPNKDIAIVHRPIDTQRIGAVQSLGDSSNFKPLGSKADILKKEAAGSSVAISGTDDAAIINKPLNVIKTDDKIKAESATTDTEVDKKTDYIPQKKKRGIFRRTAKEPTNVTTSKKDDGTVPSKADGDDSSKPSGSKNDTSKNAHVSSALITSADNIATDIKVTQSNVAIEVKAEDKKGDVSQKKKGGFFKKTPKETSDKKDKK